MNYEIVKCLHDMGKIIMVHDH